MEQRKVVPEILDCLPPGDPAALRSRRELRMINLLMGNWRWLSRELRDVLRPGVALVEIGAGDGSMARRHLPEWVHYRGVDRAMRPRDLPASWTWEQRDVLEGGEFSGQLLVANLFLHHFCARELQRLGSLVAGTVERMLFCEPYRHPVHLWQGRLLHLFGLSEVTRHDMRVSIAAGFRPGELASLLALEKETWQVVESRSLFGALRFRADRRKRKTANE